MVLTEFLNEWNNNSNVVSAHTSGSTGKPKTIFIKKKAMLASAKQTCDFLKLKANDTALLCMSLKYIGAKMMVVRAIERQMKLVSVNVSGNPMREVNEDITFAAMVPLQVYNSLKNKDERDKLMKIKHLIIGGAAIDTQLEAELKTFPNYVWSTYGMTETISHVALRRINGENSNKFYSPFKDINVSLNEEQCLMIDVPYIDNSPIITNDIANICENGRDFYILGRKDNIICSGGIKVMAEEVEQTIKQHTACNLAISKQRNEKFGEIVVLFFEEEDEQRMKQICKNHLSKFQRPKKFIKVAKIPLTENNKVDRKALLNVEFLH